MPDWFYRTVARPILFWNGAEDSRDFVATFMGRVASLPFGLGGGIIDLLGHTRPAESLKRLVARSALCGPVGLGSVVDPAGVAGAAWKRFGFSVIEVGPVGHVPAEKSGSMRLDRRQETIELKPNQPCVDPVQLLCRLRKGADAGSRVLVRFAPPASEDLESAVQEIARLCVDFSGTAWGIAVHPPGDSAMRADFVSRLGPKLESAGFIRWFVVVSPYDHNASSAARAAGACGCLIRGEFVDDGTVKLNRFTLVHLVETIRRQRKMFGPDWAILTSGGIHQPDDAVELLRAGADLMFIDSGFVFTGPGLPKRINELVDATQSQPLVVPSSPPRMVEQSWFWALLLGTAMLIGSFLALAIASTRVVLPYDEQFCGWSRPEIESHNPRLLPFLTHDRVCLAGSMIAIGLTYVSLAWHGIRRGMHWARFAVISSAGSGFASFFLFLGFGYLDPFHAFVTAVLSQLFALAIFGKETAPVPPRALDRTTDATWLRGQWGQFLLILHAVALMVAGLSIAGIGVTNVLVWTDLNFLGTSLEGMKAANPKLLPLVAHDRATFGGMLIALGLAWLLSLLWGFRKAEGWLWWSKLAGGAAFYAAALGVHFHVGYVDLWHLVPAFAGAALIGLGLFLSRSWLLGASDGQ